MERVNSTRFLDFIFCLFDFVIYLYLISFQKGVEIADPATEIGRVREEEIVMTFNKYVLRNKLIY